MAAALVGGLLASVPWQLGVAQGQAGRPDIMPVSEIRPGMKGYGLTVFEGTTPEKFGVEVIDVIKNFRPRQDAILIKTEHPRLEVAKVVRGMSGSPIYIDGKMIGAYAYGWSFGQEPVAGVTPIRNMLDDMERPLPRTIQGWPLKLIPDNGAERAPQPGLKRSSLSGDGASRFAGVPGEYDLAAHAQELAERRAPSSDEAGGLRAVGTPLLMGGVSDGALGLARDLFQPLGLEPMQGGGDGGIEPGAPTRYVDGGAIAVQLIRGDMSAVGLGTVTRVEGDRLVAFGHPMMESGVTSLPTAVGRVSWLLASQAASFKIGVAVRPVGSLINDRQASIVVSQSAQAPVIPVSLVIEGVPGMPDRRWDFEVAHEKFMTPSFLAVALGNAVQTTANERQDVSWQADSKVEIQGYGELDLEDFGVSVGGTPDMREFGRSNLVASIGGILTNPWEQTFVKRVTTRIKLSYARELVRLRGAQVLESEVDAGSAARIRLLLVPYAGKPFTRVITVPIPKHLAGRTVKLTIRPGHSVPREKPLPDSLGEFIETLKDPIYPPKSVVVSYDDGTGVAFRGRIAQQLPPGALDSIAQKTDTVAPESFKSEVRNVTLFDDFMIGSDTVSVRVKPVLR
jgi:SpoIVB peptidase S55